MKHSFRKPDFSEGDLEFRVDDDGLCIYGNPEGLTWLAQKCLALVDADKSTHIHLADYQILTPASISAALALFRE